MYIRIFSFIKNEDHLLKDWLDHHGAIVPWWAIHVYDNNSTDNTYDILQEYKKKYKINVYSHDVFKEKGEVITKKINTYKTQPGISVPLDGDEFICLWDDKNQAVITDPTCIKSYIHSLHGTGEIYSTRGWLNCIPEKPAYERPVHIIDKFKWDLVKSDMSKKFFDNLAFRSVDLGYHHGKSLNNKRVETDIVYLHYHDTGRDRKKSRCEDIINGHNIPMTLINERITSGEIITGNQFDGVGRVNEYININNWKYEPIGEDFDVQVIPGWV